MIGSNSCVFLYFLFSITNPPKCSCYTCIRGILSIVRLGFCLELKGVAPVDC